MTNRETFEGPTRNDTDSVLTVHTLGEAAAILRVKQSWIERQAAARKIPFTMLGGAYRFTSAHLIEIVRIHENVPAVGARDREADPRTPRPRQAVGPLVPTPLRPRPRTGSRQAA
jgi:excisionase family DNA binding protein